MENQMTTAKLVPGVTMHWLQDKRYRENRLSIHLLTPLSRETITPNALLAGVLEKGSEKYPSMMDVGSKVAELYGAYFSVTAGKNGPWQDIVLSITSMAEKYTFNAEPLLAECAQFLLDTLLCPKIENGAFCKEDVLIEKKSLQEEIASEINNKRFYARKKCIEALLPGEVYALPRTGFSEDLPKITPESLYKNYQSLLRHARIEIFGVGTDEFEKLAPLFQKAFLPLSRNPVLSLESPVKKEEKKPVELVNEKMEVSQAKLVLGFETAKAINLRQEMAIRLFNLVFGGSANSKLFLHVREELSLCYYCSSSYDYYRSILLVDSGTDSQNKEQAAEAILHQLEEMKAGLFSENDLQVAKKEMMDGFKGVYDDPGRVEGFYLGGLISELGGTPKSRISMMEQVRKDELVEVAQKTHLRVLYTLDQKEAKS